jgi:hypothetical protein
VEAPGVAIGQEVEEEEEQAIQGSCALHFVRSSGLYLSRADFSVSLALFPCAGLALLRDAWKKTCGDQ